MTEEVVHNRDNGPLFWAGTSAAIIAMLGIGWYFGQQREIPTSTVSAAVCEPIPAGMTYRGGELVPLAAASVDVPTVDVTTPEPVEVTAPAAPSGDWLKPIAASFPALGFPWMGLDLDNKDVRVTGRAPNAELKADGFDIAERAIRNADDAPADINRIINDIKIERGRPQWASNIETGVKGLGFDWLNLAVRGPVATVAGTAPSVEARDQAFASAEAALQRNPQAAAQISRIINGITVEGEAPSAASALVELSNSASEEGLSVGACNAAFADTLDGRVIAFQTGSSQLSLENTQLLDALTGIAILCTETSGHSIEIGGHTDSRGSEASNQRLSQNRASAVRDYLVNLGVNGEMLRAFGYGETQPINPAQTAEAYAQNRRTEFKVFDAE